MEPIYPELQIIKLLQNEHVSLSTIKFTNSQHTIGRSLNNSTVIPAIGISRIHCVFSQRQDSTWTIKDFSSAGITVNGLTIPKDKEYLLNDRDIIKLDSNGNFTYVFQHESVENNTNDQSKIEQKDFRDEEFSFSSERSEVSANETSKLKHKIDKNIRKRETSFEKGNTISETTNTMCSIDLASNINSADSGIVNSEIKFRVLENENKKLVFEINNQKEHFNKRIEEILHIKQKKIDELERALSEEKTCLENEKLLIAQKSKEDIKLITSNKEIEIRDLKLNFARCQEQKEKEIEKLNSKIQLFKEALLSEKNKLSTSEELLITKEHEISALAKKFSALEGSKKEMQIALNQLKYHYQSLLKRKEEEKEISKAAVEAKRRKLDIDSQNATSQCSTSAERLCEYIELDKLIKSELQCSICGELFIKATVLNCGHTFCKYCVCLWKKKKNSCPVCRATIRNESQNIVLDSLIESSLSKLDGNLRTQRLQCIKERENEENRQKLSHSHRKKSRRRYHHYY